MQICNSWLGLFAFLLLLFSLWPRDPKGVSELEEEVRFLRERVEKMERDVLWHEERIRITLQALKELNQKNGK